MQTLANAAGAHHLHRPGRVVHGRYLKPLLLQMEGMCPGSGPKVQHHAAAGSQCATFQRRHVGMGAKEVAGRQRFDLGHRGQDRHFRVAFPLLVLAQRVAQRIVYVVNIHGWR
ncbi:MAG: hypothetical protein AAGB22_03265 [Bacteroidota bacterium]